MACFVIVPCALCNLQRVQLIDLSLIIAVAPEHRAGSIEYAIAEDRMTDDGGLWVPLEEDVTLKR